MAAALDSLMDCKPGTPEHEQYAVFDPKMPSAGRTAAPGQLTGPFRDAIVFVIGGGNYLEREVCGCV